MEQTRAEIEKNLINNCDAILFGTYLEEDKLHTVMNFIQSVKGKRVIPTDLGFKFNILLFKNLRPEEKDIDLFTAIIGDPKGYVERMGKLGYCGMVIKNKAFKKNSNLGLVVSKNLSIYGFSELLIKKVLKTTIG